MKNTFLLLLLFSSVSVISQKIIVDSTTKSAIPFVEIYTADGNILGTTDFDGEISQSLIAEIHEQNIEKIYFHHNCYENKIILFEELSNSSGISLVPKQLVKDSNLNKLNAPSIPLKSNKEIKLESVNVSTKKYLKLTAYFTSIKYINNLPQYYMDGIIEYYIKYKD